MTGPKGNRRTRRLGPRLMVLMGLALLPLTVLSYVQGAKSSRLSESRAEAAILGDTLTAATPMHEGLTRARGGAQALAALVATLPAADCSPALARFVAGSGGFYSFAGFTRTDGFMGCASKGAGQDYSASERFRSLIADPRPRISSIPAAKISGTAVLTLTEPVRAADGALLGLVSLSIPQDVLRHDVAAPDAAESEPLALIVLDGQGQVLTSTLALDQTPPRLPANWQASALSGDLRQSFVDRAADGAQSAFALVPIVPGEIYLLGSWPVSRLQEGLIGGNLPALVFPLLIWAASLLVVWIAAETQVLRHVRQLRGAITDFAAGSRRGWPGLDFSEAPAELSDMGEAFQSMTEAVTQGEAELENIIHQKQLLLREVHHRVKNNLQLIASILNMQSRTTQSPETRAAMRSIQERVLSLATIHRELYQTSGLAEVQMAELLPQIVRHHLKLAAVPGRDYDLQFRIDDIRLTPEQAVPLALLLTEAMANVIRHGWAAPGGRVNVSLDLLRRGDGTARMVLANSLPPGPMGALDPAPADAFGNQLLAAFSSQIEGELTLGPVDGAVWQLAVTFPIRADADAEEAVLRASA